MTSWNDLPNEIKDQIITDLIESILQLDRAMYFLETTCCWSSIHALEVAAPGTKNNVVSIAGDMKRACDASIEHDRQLEAASIKHNRQLVAQGLLDEETLADKLWKRYMSSLQQSEAKRRAEMLEGLINELIEPGSDKGCWACRFETKRQRYIRLFKGKSMRGPANAHLVQEPSGQERA